MGAPSAPRGRSRRGGRSGAGDQSHHPQEATSPFPPAEIAKFRTITADTLAKVDSGDQRAATSRVKDLETAWDDDQSILEPNSEKAWTFLDGEIDRVLEAVRAPHPDKATEADALNMLLTSLG